MNFRLCGLFYQKHTGVGHAENGMDKQRKNNNCVKFGGMDCGNL